MPRQQTAEIVVAATGGEADVDRNGLALVKRIGLGGPGPSACAEQQGCPYDGTHKSRKEVAGSVVLHGQFQAGVAISIPALS